MAKALFSIVGCGVTMQYSFDCNWNENKNVVWGDMDICSEKKHKNFKRGISKGRI